MHHGNEMPEEVRQIINSESHKRDFEKEYVNKPGTERPPVFGGTGRFPEGSMGKGDEGEIAFGVASDRRARKVFLNFGKPVSWIGSNPEQARDLARLLWEHANKAEGKPTSFAELDAVLDTNNAPDVYIEPTNTKDSLDYLMEHTVRFVADGTQYSIIGMRQKWLGRLRDMLTDYLASCGPDYEQAMLDAKDNPERVED